MDVLRLAVVISRLHRDAGVIRNVAAGGIAVMTSTLSAVSIHGHRYSGETTRLETIRLCMKYPFVDVGDVLTPCIII